MKRFWIVAVLGFLFFSVNAIAGKAEKGKIVVEIGDNFLEKKSEIKYFLQRKDTSLVPLSQEHLRDYPPPRPGQRAILSPKGKLHLSPYSKNKASSSEGEIRILIVLISPADEDTPWEAGEAEGYLESSKNFFEDKRQHSKNTLSIEVKGWLKSEKTKGELTAANGNSVSVVAISEAVKLADDSVDFTEIDCLFVVVADNDWTFTWAWASMGAGYTQTDDGICDFSHIRMGSDLFSSGSYLNPHEFGHALFGLYHEAGENIAKKDTCGYTGSEPKEYNSFASIMGDRYSFFSLYTQYKQLGWLDKERVISFSSDFTSVELCPREVLETNKKQLGIIEISDNKHISIELYEKSLELYLNDDNVKRGLVIREHGEVVNNNGYGGYDATVLLKEDDDYESFLHPSEEICGLGTDGNISIKYVSLTGEGEGAIAEVEVTIDSAPEPTPSPSPSPTPMPSPPPPPPTPPPLPSPSPSPTPEITPTPSPMPTEPATSDVEKINIFSTKIKGEKLLIRKGKEVEISVEALAEGPYGDVPIPNVEVTAKVSGKRIKISPSNALTNNDGQAKFMVTARKAGRTKITFQAGGKKKSIIVKVK
ncbi:MAG: Esterase, PHB depolymerase family [Parcubacteria group bacterium GW2011_GWB1_43_8]|nr:MAG: Esterase, PHB depolymerase family [Parcubacteria group bacterium GW2011_GWB1_43_8]